MSCMIKADNGYLTVMNVKQKKNVAKSLRMEANEWFEGAEGIQYWDLKLHNTCN